MAQVWQYEENWRAVELVEPIVALARDMPSVAGESGDALQPAPLLLRDLRDIWGEKWTVVAGSGGRLLVNGDHVDLGLRVLRDRDEIVQLDRPPADGSVGDAPAAQLFYFSTERLPEVVEFVPGERPASCARCRNAITAGMVVRCPNPRCRQWHHESKTQPCWSHLEVCGAAGCGWPTQMTEYRWRPDDQ